MTVCLSDVQKFIKYLLQATSADAIAIANSWLGMGPKR